MRKMRKDKLQSKLEEMKRKREFFKQKEKESKNTFQETDGMNDDEMWMDSYHIFHD